MDRVETFGECFFYS